MIEIQNLAKQNQIKELDDKIKKLENEVARPRLGSGETIQTIETQTIAESKADLNASKINYEKLKNVMGINLGDPAAGTGSLDTSA